MSHQVQEPAAAGDEELSPLRNRVAELEKDLGHARKLLIVNAQEKERMLAEQIETQRHQESGLATELTDTAVLLEAKTRQENTSLRREYNRLLHQLNLSLELEGHSAVSPEEGDDTAKTGKLTDVLNKLTGFPDPALLSATTGERQRLFVGVKEKDKEEPNAAETSAFGVVEGDTVPAEGAAQGADTAASKLGEEEITLQPFPDANQKSLNLIRYSALVRKQLMRYEAREDAALQLNAGDTSLVEQHPQEGDEELHEGEHHHQQDDDEDEDSEKKKKPDVVLQLLSDRAHLSHEHRLSQFVLSMQALLSHLTRQVNTLEQLTERVATPVTVMHKLQSGALSVVELLLHEAVQLGASEVVGDWVVHEDDPDGGHGDHQSEATREDPELLPPEQIRDSLQALKAFLEGMEIKRGALTPKISLADGIIRNAVLGDLAQLRQLSFLTITEHEYLVFHVARRRHLLTNAFLSRAVDEDANATTPEKPGHPSSESNRETPGATAGTGSAEHSEFNLLEWVLRALPTTLEGFAKSALEEAAFSPSGSEGAVVGGGAMTPQHATLLLDALPSDLQTVFVQFVQHFDLVCALVASLLQLCRAETDAERLANYALDNCTLGANDEPVLFEKLDAGDLAKCRAIVQQTKEGVDSATANFLKLLPTAGDQQDQSQTEQRTSPAPVAVDNEGQPIEFPPLWVGLKNALNAVDEAVVKEVQMMHRYVTRFETEVEALRHEYEIESNKRNAESEEEKLTKLEAALQREQALSALVDDYHEKLSAANKADNMDIGSLKGPSVAPNYATMAQQLESARRYAYMLERRCNTLEEENVSLIRKVGKVEPPLVGTEGGRSPSNAGVATMAVMTTNAGASKAPTGSSAFSPDRSPSHIGAVPMVLSPYSAAKSTPSRSSSPPQQQQYTADSAATSPTPIATQVVLDMLKNPIRVD